MASSSPTSTPKYRLRLLQQPTAGSAFGANLLSRTALAPPLILELETTQDGASIDASADLPFLICQCSLLDERGEAADLREEPVASAPPLAPASPARSRKGRKSSSTVERASETSSPTTPADSQLARMLYGTLVASPQLHRAPEEEEGEKVYFFFPEISVRATGKFKIVCRLMRLPL